MTQQLLRIGDCRKVLEELEPESIDCVVTSPPYWGLRDYGTEPLIWDGKKDCKHEWGTNTYCPTKCGTQGSTETKKWPKMQKANSNPPPTRFCSKCGAWKGQLGLEPGPDLYIKHLCDIFDQIKRVLKPTGTCWVNIGDTYAGSGGAGGDYNEGGLREGQPKYKQGNADVLPKSLVQIPSRFVLEMMKRGWINRNEIIWHKPACLPDSTKDRFTVDFEKMFFFVKNQRYWFEQQFEPLTESTKQRMKYDQWVADVIDPRGRNKRCVWTISSKPYSEAHFATFPLALIDTPIKAGCPKEVCPKCGFLREAIWEKVQGNTTGIKKNLVGYTDCDCNAGYEPGWVLDPFAGSGTVLEYCRLNGYNGIGIELNPEYEKLITERARLNTPQLDIFLEEAIE
ncbi:MAG: site-specific DNA-methyltransferase [Dehalococcoidales bacterium]|nr:site-specific DNA-methyltransferase [Candidatus Thermoplasmatota archaeon]MDD5511342.1 site-specific DNA-methyltransferase [Dehalococcoidales bacterium]